MTNKNTVNVLIFSIIVVTAVILISIITATKNDTGNNTNSQILSHHGAHIHSKLFIYIKGQQQTIPANIGLEPVEQPIHTHDADNIIHLEFPGLVTLDNTRLQEFFKVWDKQFNSNCIFDYCNGPSGTIRMFVNGQPNNDFEKYPMKDEDQIEIRYE